MLLKSSEAFFSSYKLVIIFRFSITVGVKTNSGLVRSGSLLPSLIILVGLTPAIPRSFYDSFSKSDLSSDLRLS